MRGQKVVANFNLLTSLETDLTLTPLNLTKHYYRNLCKNWSKSDYVIDTGPIHVRNRWPGSVTGVVWHGWSRDWCARGPGINSGENHHFSWCQFQMRIERDEGEKVQSVRDLLVHPSIFRFWCLCIFIWVFVCFVCTGFVE